MSTTPTPAVQEGYFHCGGVDLYRRSVLPVVQPRAHLIVLHGYGEHSGRHFHFLNWLAGEGIAGHTFDFRGHGRSSGRRGYVQQWHDYVFDLEAYLALPSFLTAKQEAPLFLLGHSHGGLVLAHAAIRGLSDAHGCILTAPFLRPALPIPRSKTILARLANPIVPWLPVPSGLRDEWMSSDEAMRQESQGDPLINRFATPRWFLGALQAQRDVFDQADRFEHPLLLLAGDRDPVACPAAAEEFFRLAGSEDKRHRPLEGFLHEILRDRGRENIFRDIRDWILARAGSPLLPRNGG